MIRLRRGDPNRLNILVARFSGEKEPSLNIRQRIKELLNKVLELMSDRPFKIINFPLTLRSREVGKDVDQKSMSALGLGCVKTQVPFSKVEILTQPSGFRSDRSS